MLVFTSIFHTSNCTQPKTCLALKLDYKLNLRSHTTLLGEEIQTTPASMRENKILMIASAKNICNEKTNTSTRTSDTRIYMENLLTMRGKNHGRGPTGRLKLHYDQHR
jgi:hypothetical protein